MKARIALSLVLFACGEAKPPKAPDAPKPIEGTMLLFPHADAEALLGREVTEAPGGGFQIADARAPGCEVIARRSKAQYHAVRDSQTSQLAAIGVGYKQIVSLDAKLGRQSHARLELDNTEVVHGDVRGPCGRRVITKVFVGHGKRTA
jgi:hypothetical protein